MIQASALVERWELLAVSEILRVAPVGAGGCATAAMRSHQGVGNATTQTRQQIGGITV
jgi:hypothetical protein